MGVLEMNIVDVSGKVLEQEKWQQPKGNYSRSISVGKLPAGIYWLQLNGAGNMQRVKIVKQ
jgi:hypothetical protein